MTLLARVAISKGNPERAADAYEALAAMDHNTLAAWNKYLQTETLKKAAKRYPLWAKLCNSMRRQNMDFQHVVEQFGQAVKLAGAGYAGVGTALVIAGYVAASILARYCPEWFRRHIVDLDPSEREPICDQAASEEIREPALCLSCVEVSEPPTLSRRNLR
jgi:hypothetical protein